RAQANYRVANRNEQFLTLEFPEDCQVWSVFVAGQPARPARSMRDGKQVVLAPLPKTAAGDFSAVVEVVYTGALPAAAFTAPVVGSAVGGLAADWAVPTPRVVGLPVAETQWTLYLPRDFNYGWFRGTLEEVDGGALDLNRAAAVYREAFRLVGEANYGKGTAKGRARDNLMELKQRGIQPSTSATQAAAVRNKEKFIELQQRVQSEASQLSQAIEQLEKQPAAPGAGPVRWDEFFDAPAAQPQQPTNENLFRTPQQQLGKSVADYEEKNVRYRLNRRLESQTANLNSVVKQQSDQLKNAEVEQLRDQVAAQEQAGSSFGSILGRSQTLGGDAGKKKATDGRDDYNQANWYLQNRFGQLGDNSDKRGSAKDAAELGVVAAAPAMEPAAVRRGGLSLRIALPTSGRTFHFVQSRGDAALTLAAYPAELVQWTAGVAWLALCAAVALFLGRLLTASPDGRATAGSVLVVATLVGLLWWLLLPLSVLGFLVFVIGAGGVLGRGATRWAMKPSIAPAA
ncbi:MAG: hypothetical protein ACRC1K_16070, partial [Planctomycetia bacterium]